MVTYWSVIKTGHSCTCRGLVQTPEKLIWLIWKTVRTYLASKSVIWFWDLLILWMEELMPAKRELIIWVYGLILQSGGLERSAPFKKWTNCWLSDNKVASCRSNIYSNTVASIIAADSAITLMKMLNGETSVYWWWKLQSSYGREQRRCQCTHSCKYPVLWWRSSTSNVVILILKYNTPFYFP